MDNAKDDLETPVEWPQPLGIFARDLFRRADEYLGAAEHLAAGNTKVKFPTYMLLAHSLELFLKAFLSCREVPKKDTKSMLHNLDAIMAAAEQRGLPHVDHLRGFTATLQEMNRDHDFRYPTGYRLSLPKPQDCIDVIAALRERIEAEIERASVIAETQLASDTRHLRGRKLVWSD
jgi:hypothetical protein